MNTKTKAETAPYRIKPSLGNALIVVLVYTIIIITLQMFSGDLCFRDPGIPALVSGRFF